MKTTKKYMALFIVLACIGVASLLLMFDYDTATTKWAAIISSAMFFGAGVGLGHLFNRKNLLHE